MLDQSRKNRLVGCFESHRGFVFRWQRWRKLSDNWDHDHCHGCWAMFSEWPESPADRNYNEGWVTLWPVHDPTMLTEPVTAGDLTYVPSPKPGGFQLDWICADCFDAVRQALGFIIDPEHPQWKQAGL